MLGATFANYSNVDNISDRFSNFHSNNINNCFICHPNNELGNSSKAWKLKLANTTDTPYNNLSNISEIGEPNGSSKICLSCHDGTIASDQLGSQILKGIIFSNTLENNHPISFYYTSYLAQKDGKLHDPKFRKSGLGGTIEEDLLIDGKLECISCHDIHNSMNLENRLIKSNYRSALCLTCHNK